MKTNAKKVLSMLLVLLMVVGVVPAGVFADTYKSEYGITVMVGDAEMDLVADGTETCGMMQAQKLKVTVPAGTTEVTFKNITDTVMWGQMYVYSGAHNWDEFASNVKEATLSLAECGTSFCVSDSANAWYHVNIIFGEAQEPELPEEPEIIDNSVDVYMSVSYKKDFVTTDQDTVMALEKITVPYFDLADYGLEMLYYNPDCYKGDVQEGGTEETANGNVTILHLFIYATEIYQLGLTPEQAGKGVLAQEGWPYFEVYAKAPGSAFVYFWDFAENMTYYHNYGYPLGKLGWGSTCDQIVLADGDTVSVRYDTGQGENGTYYHFSAAGMTTKEILKGNDLHLTLFETTKTADYSGTGHEIAGEGHKVSVVEAIGEPALAEATTNATGDVTLDTSELAEGTYYVITDTYGPAAMLLTVKSNVHVHDYEKEVIEATCREGGYTKYTCSCGDSYEAERTPVGGHKYVDGVCSVCGHEQTIIPEGAPFIDMVTDDGQKVKVTYMGDEPSYMMGPLYKVEVPMGTRQVNVTYNQGDVLIDGFGYASALMVGFDNVSQDGYGQTSKDGKVTVGLAMEKGAANMAGTIELLNVPYTDYPRCVGLMKDYYDGMHFFAFTYMLEEGQHFAVLPEGVGYTVTGEPVAEDGYTFTVALEEGYEANEYFAVKVNGETVATEPGEITLGTVDEDIEVTVEGVSKIVAETDIAITIDLTEYEGNVNAYIQYQTKEYDFVEEYAQAGRKTTVAADPSDAQFFSAYIYEISPLVVAYDINGTVYPVATEYTRIEAAPGVELCLSDGGYLTLNVRDSKTYQAVIKPVLGTKESVGEAPDFAEPDVIDIKNIDVIGADVVAYSWEGDTLNVDLAEDTPADAALKTIWTIYVNNKKEGAGQPLFNINDRMQTPSGTEATFDWTYNVKLEEGTATGTVAFGVADVPWDPASVLEFTPKTFTLNFTILNPLDAAKEAAKAELDEYKDPADYREAQQEELAAVIEEANAAIDAATTEEAVAAALAEAKAAIDEIKTDAELTAEEAAAALAKAKEDAKAELDEYKDPADYRESQQEELADAIAEGKAAIDAAPDLAGVNTAKGEAKAAMDAVKTDAQLKAEESAKDEEKEEDKNNAPATGDNAVIIFAGIMMLTFMAAIIVVMRKRKAE